MTLQRKIKTLCWRAGVKMNQSESAALDLLRTGQVVALVDGSEWSVVEQTDDPGTLWFRLRKRCEDKENDNPLDRRFVKVGPVSDDEIRHVRRAKAHWAGLFALYSVQAKDVLALRSRLRKADCTVAFLKLGGRVDG